MSIKHFLIWNYYNHKKIAFFVLVFCTFSFLTSVFSEKNQTLTLENLISKVLKNSQILKAKKSMLQMGIKQYKAAKRNRWPNLNLNAGTSFNGDFDSTIGAELSLDLKKIFTNSPKNSFLKMKKKKLLNFIAQEQIKEETAKYYIQIYLLKQKEKFYTESEVFFTSHLKNLQKLMYRGLDLKFDVQRVENRIRSLQRMKRSNYLGLENISIELSSLVGFKLNIDQIDFNNIENLNKNHFCSMNMFKHFINKEEAIHKFNQLMKHTVFWQVENINSNLAKNLVEQSKNNLWPSLILGGSSNHYQNKSPWDNNYNLYFGASFLISNLYKNNFSSQAYKYSYIAQQQILENYKRVYRIKINKLINKIESIFNEYNFAKISKEKAKQTLQLAFLQYQKGRIKETEILDVYSNLMEVQENLNLMLQKYYYNNLQLSILVRQYK